MSSQSLVESELKAKNRRIKGYKSIPISKWLSIRTNKWKLSTENYKADKILRDLDFTFYPEKDHYESKKKFYPFNNNYIECEGIGDKDKTTTIKEYLDKP